MAELVRRRSAKPFHRKVMRVRVPSGPPLFALVAQLVEALDLGSRCWGFESLQGYLMNFNETLLFDIFIKEKKLEKT